MDATATTVDSKLFLLGKNLGKNLSDIDLTNTNTNTNTNADGEPVIEPTQEQEYLFDLKE